MVGQARLAGHRFLTQVSPNLQTVAPTRNMQKVIFDDGPSQQSGNVIDHQYVQVGTGKGLEVIGARNVAMQDWDWPDEGHIAKNAITVKNLGDVYDRMQQFTSDNPDELWRMYVTPGGVRAFDLAKQRMPYKSYELQSQLNSDPLYAGLVDQRNNWPARVSPKIGREGDFVAVPIAQMGTGVALADNQDYVRRYHDVPIMENRIVTNQLQIPESGFRLLENQANTLPSSARGIIDPLLSRVYARLSGG